MATQTCLKDWERMFQEALEKSIHFKTRSKEKHFTSFIEYYKKHTHTLVPLRVSICSRHHLTFLRLGH